MSSKNKTFLPKLLVSPIMAGIIMLGGCATKEEVVNQPSNSSFAENYNKATEKMSEQDRIELDRSINYLAGSAFYAENSKELNDSHYFKFNPDRYEKFKAKMFAGKSSKEIIKEAKEKATNDGVTEINTNSPIEFLNSYNSLSLKSEQPNKYDDKLFFTLVDASMYSDFGIKISKVAGENNSLTEEEFFNIEYDKFDRYLKQNNFKKLSDLKSRQHFNPNSNLIDSMKLVRNNYYKPLDVNIKLKRLQSSLAEQELALKNGNYQSKKETCSVQGMTYSNFQIVDTTINGKTFKTFDFDAVNSNTETGQLSLSIILRDKNEKFAISSVRHSFNNVTPKNVKEHYKVVVNPKYFDLKNMNDYKLYKLTFNSCMILDNPIYGDKQGLEQSIKNTKEKILKLQNKPA